jgi:hypothetical protein
MSYESTERYKMLVEQTFEDPYYKLKSYLHDEACRMVRKELEKAIHNE